MFGAGPEEYAGWRQVDVLERQLDDSEVDFADQGIIWGGRRGGSGLAIDGFPLMGEAEYPAAKFFPHRQAIAGHRVGACRDIEFLGPAQRQLTLDGGPQMDGEQGSGAALAGDDESIGELAGHRVRTHAEALGMHHREFGKERVVLAGDLHRNGRDGLDREKHQDIAAGNAD